MYNTDKYASLVICFPANPDIVGYKKDDFINEQIQHTCAKYTELNAAAMIADINCLWCHIVLYKEVNPDEQIAN